MEDGRYSVLDFVEGRMYQNLLGITKPQGFRLAVCCFGVVKRDRTAGIIVPVCGLLGHPEDNVNPSNSCITFLWSNLIRIILKKRSMFEMERRLSRRS